MPQILKKDRGAFHWYESLKVGNTKLKGTGVQIKGKRAYAFYLAQILSHSTTATVSNATSLALVIF